MGYRQMTITDLHDILRRWHGEHSISSIKEATARDRNTIRHYISLFENQGFHPGCELPEREELFRTLQTLLPLTKRKRGVRELFEKHKGEIIELINRDKEPVKAKTAFLIMKEKYDLPGSYETFKVWMREQKYTIKSRGAPLRIELPPGEETQIDYGKVGTLFDPKAGKNRSVYAFCAILSCSRLPFIQFVFSQNQESFVESNVDMAEFYGGVTKFLTIDNLKDGVIKPDLYDPGLNRAYAEFAEHYGTFINPCRVAKATDKGKIERAVPGARELFRRLKEVHPAATLRELNGKALLWCREEYGMKKHGTTGLKPFPVFEEEEKETLLPLPEERFTVPIWKHPMVQPDRFFVFAGKYYAMPYAYRKKRVRARKTGKVLHIFDEKYNLLRTYTVTGKLFSSLPGDFPEDREAMMRGEYPRWILAQARGFGPNAERLIEEILEPHAYINARRARGMVSVFSKYKDETFFHDICGKALEKKIHTPKKVTQLFEAEKLQTHFSFIHPVSQQGQAMIRDVMEYFN